MGWLEFVVAFTIFFATHSVPVSPRVRPRLVALAGRRVFAIGYSLLSLAMLMWVISAAARAPRVGLWDWAPWQNLVPLGGMALAFLLAALAVGRPNPFSFGGGRDEQFDPENPGLAGWVRHPLLAALGIWALSHVVPNGDLAHVVLFSIFAIFAFAGMGIVDRKKKREMGAGAWRTRLDAVRRKKRGLGMSGGQAALRISIAAVLYVSTLLGHPALFGVSPLN